MKKLILAIGIFAFVFLFSCVAKHNVKGPHQAGVWQYVGKIKKSGDLLYLNSSYVRYDKKAKLYKAILKEMPSIKEQNAIKKQFEEANKETEKRFKENLKGREMVLSFFIDKKTGYYIITTNCKNNKFTIHYPIFNDSVKVTDTLGKNIYSFICHNKNKK